MSARSMQAELQQLLHQTSAGDHAAFQELYTRSAGKLFAIGMNMLKRKDQAEEALQEAYVKIWHHAGEYHAERGEVSTWMAAIMRYRCLDRLRHNQKKAVSSVDTDEDLSFEGPEPAELTERQENAARLHSCLSNLRQAQRQVISLAFLSGLSHREITQSVQQPLGTVKSLIRRGLQSLQRCLQQ